VVYVEALGPAAFIGRARVVPLRNTGAAISPFNSFLILQGIETLPVRMDRHCENASRLLSICKAIRKLPGSIIRRWPTAPISRWSINTWADAAPASSVSASRAGATPGAKFIDALQLVTRLVNIGDAKSLACHPATTTHRQLSPAELARAGVSEDLVRLSIGIEHIDDILADLEQALAAAK
jgi:O-acetylhomoserine (thiol)-lyase